MPESVIHYRKDYKPYSHTIVSVGLNIVLDPEATLVTTSLVVAPKQDAETLDLVLDGQDLVFKRLTIDGIEAPETRYELTENALRIHGVNRRSSIVIVNQISPSTNTLLSGLYMSQGAFMTQCESQGFRRITYYPDRPDVMSRFTVTIHADKNLYPVLLSNGNQIGHGDEANNRHWVRFEDPFKKPAYLFALVAGDFAGRKTRFTLKNGDNVELSVWTQPQNFDKSEHALESLKKAIRWDEERFGLELDLNNFRIVATDDFNFGAMENKGLNIFNSRYVMATPDIATDTDYDAIETVIGHEYFHNWTGNRVTLRDWFQLTLKEGLTSFRDQEFSIDMAGDAASGAICRIRDVRNLRARQFPEDAGPMAHPIRPDSYKEIDNFYTMTVYEKGAEVIRMLQTMFGRDGFAKGLTQYIKRNDGSAATCENFIEAMAEANKADLTQFSLWWSQAGTPRVSAELRHDEQAKTVTLRLTQMTPATPGQPLKRPFVIPVTIGLLDLQGKDMMLAESADDAMAPTQKTLLLTEESQSWTFVGIDKKPTLSLGRNFSAPVIFESNQSNLDLAFLAAHDSDPFNRAEALHKLALNNLNACIDAIERQEQPAVSESFIKAYEAVLTNETLSEAFRAEALVLPSENEIALSRTMIDPDSIHKGRQFILQTLARRLDHHLGTIVENCQPKRGYRPGQQKEAGMRALKNFALALWMYGANPRALLSARTQFDQADNLTDRLASLTMLANSQSPAKIQVLRSAIQSWANEPLLVNKWLTVQATAPSHPKEPTVVEQVKRLTTFPKFSIKNPNNVYALLNAFFTNNPAEFHRADGSGYTLWKDAVLALDAINPHVSGRLARALDGWRHYEPARAKMMYNVLNDVAKTDNLSVALREIVEKALHNN